MTPVTIHLEMFLGEAGWAVQASDASPAAAIARLLLSDFERADRIAAGQAGAGEEEKVAGLLAQDGYRYSHKLNENRRPTGLQIDYENATHLLRIFTHAASPTPFATLFKK